MRWRWPRRGTDLLRATKTWARITAGIVISTIVLVGTAHATGATDASLNIVDLAVLGGILAQTATIAFFAGTLTNRITHIEQWRTEHMHWSAQQMETLARLDQLEDAMRRLETIERRCEAELIAAKQTPVTRR